MTEYIIEMRDGAKHIFHDLKEYQEFSKKHYAECKSATVIDYIGPTHASVEG